MKKEYIKRTISPEILNLSRNFKVLLVTGPRQVGKTTLLKQLADEDRKVVDMSDITDRDFASADPKGFLDTYSLPLFIDGVQYVPNLFSYIRMLVDKIELNGQIWLTGSGQFELMEHITDSLAGRVVIIQLQGFSIYERNGIGELQEPFLPAKEIKRNLSHKNSKDTFKVIWQGSAPEVINMDEKTRYYFYDSYIKTYLERDIRKIINIKDEITFRRFIKVIAARTAQILNFEDISKDVGISANTAKQWLSVLTTSGLVFLLQPYFKNITKRLIKSPKLYFLDTGLAAHLAGWTTPESLETGASAGAFFETFTISEILKSYWHNGENPDIYYYRDSDGKEIDLIINKNNIWYPIEIKKHATPNIKDISAFATFAKIPDIIMGEGVLICLVPEPQALSSRVMAISLWDL